ncbi:chorismate mutase [Streptococcus hongkongensis]|nr:hypothetical protein NC01_09445 [Streptococcus uberis]
MELELIRKEIDQIDSDLVQLIEKRVSLVDHVMAYKRQHQIPVLDEERQQFILEDIRKQVSNLAYVDAVLESFEGIMAASRHYQTQYLTGDFND